MCARVCVCLCMCLHFFTHIIYMDVCGSLTINYVRLLFILHKDHFIHFTFRSISHFSSSQLNHIVYAHYNAHANTQLNSLVRSLVFSNIMYYLNSIRIGQNDDIIWLLFFFLSASMCMFLFNLIHILFETIEDAL